LKYSSIYIHSFEPLINPNPRPHLTVTWIRTLPLVTWETARGLEGISWWGLVRHTLANGALFYRGRYRAEGCMALG